MFAAILAHPFLAACWGILVLIFGIEIGIYIQMSLQQAEEAPRPGRLSWCPNCGEAMQDGYCQNCRDLPAGWLEATRGQLRARERREAQERAVLDRRAQEAAARAARG